MALTISKKPAAGVVAATAPAEGPIQHAWSGTPPVILGLDISTKAGIAMLDYRHGPPELHLSCMHFPVDKDRKDRHDAKYNQYARWQKYEQTFDSLLELWKPTFAVVEGYGFASQSLSVIVEVSTHFKRALHRRGIPWVELKPSALKKFCTGKGACDKNVMLLEAYKRFGIDTKDDNECDAGVLAYAGAALVGLPTPNIPAVHREALKGLPDPCN